MPTWTYRCLLDHTFDLFLPRIQEELPCPECGCVAKRQFTLPQSDQIRIHGGFHISRSQVAEPKNPKVWAMGGVGDRREARGESGGGKG